MCLDGSCRKKIKNSEKYISPDDFKMIIVLFLIAIFSAAIYFILI